jgi:hypothetical protein
MSTYYIGIGGVSRAGKDLLGATLKNELLNYFPTKTVSIFSLATPLKADCKNFVFEKLGLDVFTNNTEEKTLFRELLVWYGKVKRQQTEGTYWTMLLDERVKKEKPDICIVPDIRYFQYKKDEVPWLKAKKKNSFFHIQRLLDNNEIVAPANMDEQINDSIIRKYADKCLLIPTYDQDSKKSEIQKIALSLIENYIKVKITNEQL